MLAVVVVALHFLRLRVECVHSTINVAKIVQLSAYAFAWSLDTWASYPQAKLATHNRRETYVGNCIVSFYSQGIQNPDKTCSSISLLDRSSSLV